MNVIDYANCKRDTIGPGVYANMPAKVYHSLPYASASRLNRMMESSPAHAHHEMTHPKEPTPAMKLGTAIHTRILEASEFANVYVQSEFEEFRTDIAKNWKKGVESRGYEVLGKSQWELVSNVNQQALMHPMAGALLDSRTHTELSLVWDDVDSGVRCKARIDGLAMIDGTPALVDLKTTSDASCEGFEKSIFNFGYHRQMAFYREALALLGVYVEHTVIIAVETTAPHAVATYRVKDEVLDHGRKEFKELLAIWKECVASDVWPGYSDQIVDIGLPEWVMRKERI